MRANRVGNNIENAAPRCKLFPCRNGEKTGKCERKGELKRIAGAGG